MKYSQNWLYIDTLLLISFLPLISILPLLVQIYFILALIFLILNKNYSKLLLYSGIITVLISFSSYFSLHEIPKFKDFITLLISLLTVAVLSQRALGEKNIYLKLSPYIFFLFSVIFFQNIYMLFYAIFEIFIFLSFLINSQINNFKLALKEALKIFLISLPFVVVLFLIFPRYAIKAPKIGFKSSYVSSGFSDRMSVDSSSVNLTNQVVFEAKFNESVKALYFRGAVLYRYFRGVWTQDNRFKDYMKNPKDIVEYKLKLYPTNQKYIFALDIPLDAPQGAILTSHYTLYSEEKIKKSLNLRLESAQSYNLFTKKIPKEALYFNKKYNLKTQKELNPIKNIKDENLRLKKLIEYFKNKKIVYSTTPPKFDRLNSVDEFYRLKKGYCVHFASAFALSARMIGLPSRVVSGFLADRESLYKNYVVVREKDAHAWVEIYLKDKGWQRVDPTKFAYKVKGSQNIDNKSKLSKEELIFMYLRFQIEQWVLYYDSYKQKKLKKLLKKREFLVKFIIAFIVLIVFIIFTTLYLNREKIPLEDRLIKKLIKNKPKNSTIYKYLKSFEDKRLDKINQLYHKIKFYKYNNEDLKELKRLVREYLKKSK